MNDNREIPSDDKSQKTIHVKLTGRMLNFTRLQLQGDDPALLFEKIEEKFSKQQNSKLPVVISYTGKVALTELWQKLWAVGLQPIGIIPSSDEQSEQAVAQKIAIFPADGQRIDGKNTKSTVSEHKTPDQNVPDTTPVVEPKNSPNEKEVIIQIPTTSTDHEADNHHHLKNTLATDDKLQISQADSQQNVEGDLVHHQMLRSGQSINHVGGDVILTKGINAGAEAITDYSLHIYGKAEGRLVAGATGDRNARIFCMKFNPSLVSVAGTYCLKENIPAEFLNQAVEVSFDDKQGLVFSLIE